jgi:hypothetical protein
MVSRNFVIFPPSAVKDPSTIASQGLKVKKNDCRESSDGLGILIR